MILNDGTVGGLAAKIARHNEFQTAGVTDDRAEYTYLTKSVSYQHRLDQLTFGFAHSERQMKFLYKKKQQRIPTHSQQHRPAETRGWLQKKKHQFFSLWSAMIAWHPCCKIVTGYLHTQFGEDRCTQFRVIVVTDPQTHPPTHTNRQDWLQYTALQLR